MSLGETNNSERDRPFARLLRGIWSGEEGTLFAYPQQLRKRHFRCARLLSDEGGKISFLTVVVVGVFLVLIGLVARSGEAVLEKIKLQNAADSAAYSTALCQARRMNALTAINHMMGELTALLVLHDAIGGPTLDKQFGTSDEGTTEYTDEAAELDKIVDGLRKKSTNELQNEAPYGGDGFLGGTFESVDKELFDLVFGDRLPEMLLHEKEENEHFAGAMLYDARMTLKAGAASVMIAKAWANDAQFILGKVKNFPPIGIIVAICDGMHVLGSYDLARIGFEWLNLYAVELGARAFAAVKDVIPVAIKTLSLAQDAIVGISLNASGGSWGSAQGTVSMGHTMIKTTLDDLIEHYKADAVGLAVYPGLAALRLPVVPERPPVTNSTGDNDESRKFQKPPSLLRKSDEDHWSGPLPELLKLQRQIFDKLAILKQFSRFHNYGDLISGIFNINRDPSKIKLYYEENDWKDVEKEDAEGYRHNKGSGYPQNPSIEDLKSIDWESERTSQWVRATYPYVETFREPIREWMHIDVLNGFFGDAGIGRADYSRARMYFTHWTNRYTLARSHELRKKQRDNNENDEENALDRARRFVEKIRQLRVELEEALEPKGDLDNAQPVKQFLEQVSERLTAFVENELDDDIKNALDELGVDVQQWVDAVTNHRKEVDDEAGKVENPPELEIDDSEFKSFVKDVTLTAKLRELLDILTSITKAIDDVLNLFDSTPHMYVMVNTQDAGKGNEPWAESPHLAEDYFTIVGFAYRRDSPAPFFGKLFPNRPASAVAFAQSMYYNAGGRDMRRQNTDLQPDTGWDTLNWKVPVEAREWGDSRPSGKGTTDPWGIFVLQSRDAQQENSRVELNWQAKLVPVTKDRLTDSLNDSKLDRTIRDAMKVINTAQYDDLLSH